MALENQRVVYGILFRAASETLKELAADPKHLGAEIGILAVLHTWGQNLMCFTLTCTAWSVVEESHLMVRAGCARNAVRRARRLSSLL